MLLSEGGERPGKGIKTIPAGRAPREPQDKDQFKSSSSPRPVASQASTATSRPFVLNPPRKDRGRGPEKHTSFVPNGRYGDTTLAARGNVTVARPGSRNP